MTTRDNQPTNAANPYEAALPRLARDILVNVIANLIAAAIVYVLGAAEVPPWDCSRSSRARY